MQCRVVGGLLVVILSTMAGISEGIPISIAPVKAEVHKAAQEAAKGMVFQDINIIQLTDVHSWLSGHIHEDGMGADYADCLSFYEHLKTMASEQEKDLWLFDSGDIVEGTGLSDATEVPGEMIYPIIQAMPYDAITCGNHELYHSETVHALQSSGFIESWKGKYLTGNIHDSATGELLGNPYTVLTGAFGKRLLMFGFLYNMLNTCDAVNVTKVQEVVEMDWFKNALINEGSTTHAIVILSHFDVKDPLVEVILTAVRKYQAVTPVVFLTGHTHYRGYDEPDFRSVSMESGKYLDTIGLLQFDLPFEDVKPVAFAHTFYTPSVDTFMEVTGKTKTIFTTPAAKKMKTHIKKVRAKLGLDKTVGCAPSTYLVEEPLSKPDSLWELFITKVLPDALFDVEQKAIFVGHTGSLRYNLFKGKFSVDDTYIVSPFKDTFYIAESIPGQVAAAVIKDLVVKGKRDPLRDRSGAVSFLPPWVSSMDAADVDINAKYDIIGVSFDTPTITSNLAKHGAPSGTEMLPFKKGAADDRSVWEKFAQDKWPCPAEE